MLPIELVDPEVRPGLSERQRGHEQVARPSSASSHRPRYWR